MALDNEYMLEELTAEEIYQKKLTAGTNITINPITNTISAAGGGSSVQYSSNYSAGDVLGNLTINGTPTPIRTPNLVAGTNIHITQNAQTGALTFSADGGGDLAAHELTQEEYDVLTPAQKQNGELYLTHPATVGSSEPNKIYYNATLYGTEGGNDVVELTQAEWDALPSSKLTDGIIYVITDGGGGGGGSDNHAVHVPPVIYENGELKKITNLDNFPGLEKIYITPTDYVALTAEQKADLTKIYYVSEYEFITNEDNTLVLRIDSSDNALLYFIGVELENSNPLTMPSEIATYIGNRYPDSYGYYDPSDTSSPDCYINCNWSGDNAKYWAQDGRHSGTIITNTPVYGVLNPAEGYGQELVYSDPWDIQGGFTIYYGGKQYTILELPTGLPDVTSADNGDILKVVSGEWSKADAPREVPAIGLGDNDKVLTVESGEATWASPKKITHLYDEIPMENPLYRLDDITTSTSPLTIDMTQITSNYEELRATDFAFVFMNGDAISRPWQYNPIDSVPGTIEYTPSTGSLVATLSGGFNTATKFGIVYKKSVIQLTENATISGQSGTIDCSEIPDADTLTANDFAIVITNVMEISTGNTGAIGITPSLSYNQSTMQLSWSVSSASYNQLTADGYIIVSNYGDPEYKLIVDFIGATNNANGYHGFVPAPLVADRNKFLKGDGTWGIPSGSEAVYKTLVEYQALTQQQKEDPTKIYFVVNEGTKISPTLDADDGNITVSSTNGAYYPWHAFDSSDREDTGTNSYCWAPWGQNGGEWIAYSFGTKQQFSKVRFRSCTESQSTDTTFKYWVEGSNDGTTWNNLLDVDYVTIVMPKMTTSPNYKMNFVDYTFLLDTSKPKYSKIRVRVDKSVGYQYSYNRWSVANFDIYAAQATNKPSIYYKDVLYTPDELPAVIEADAGKVLKVTEDGVWDKGNVPNPLPAATASDSGKVLSVDSSGDYQLSNPTSAVSDLTDVNLTNLADGDILKYDSTSQEWINAVESGGNGTELILNAQIYSTDEKQIGVWIDGKPLYQKVFTFNPTISINGNWYKFDNGTTYAPIKGTAIQSSSQACYEVYIDVDPDGAYVRNISNATYTGITAIIMFYTKTTDVAGSGGYQAYGFSPIIYSEEEREVGVWVDNKPLYAKTYPLTNGVYISGSGTVLTSYIDNQSVIDKLIQATGIYTQQNNACTSSVFLARTNGAIKAWCSEAGTFDYINIFYTKTTDTAGSGSYNTLGVPNVHYKDDWHVVGTWWNGKPIYEKTFHYTTADLPTDRMTLEKLYDFDELVGIDGYFCYQHYSNDYRNYRLGEKPAQLSNAGIFLLCEGNDQVNDIQDLDFAFNGLDRSKVVYISATVRYTKTTD